MTKQNYYVWDITTYETPRLPVVYAVEYLTKTEGDITWKQRNVVENKARRACFNLSGDRKCMRQVNGGFYPYSGFAGTIIAVPLQTKQMKLWKGKHAKPIYDYDECEDEDGFLYEELKECVSERMGDNQYFKIEGKNINWMGASGYRYVKADNANDLIQAMYNEGSITLYAGNTKREMIFRIGTHDCPTGSTYYVKPVAESTYYKNNE